MEKIRKINKRQTAGYGKTATNSLDPKLQFTSKSFSKSYTKLHESEPCMSHTSHESAPGIRGPNPTQPGPQPTPLCLNNLDWPAVPPWGAMPDWRADFTGGELFNHSLDGVGAGKGQWRRFENGG